MFGFVIQIAGRRLYFDCIQHSADSILLCAFRIAVCICCQRLSYRAVFGTLVDLINSALKSVHGVVFDASPLCIRNVSCLFQRNSLGSLELNGARVPNIALVSGRLALVNAHVMNICRSSGALGYAVSSHVRRRIIVLVLDFVQCVVSGHSTGHALFFRIHFTPDKNLCCLLVYGCTVRKNRSSMEQPI